MKNTCYRIEITFKSGKSDKFKCDSYGIDNMLTMYETVLIGTGHVSELTAFSYADMSIVEIFEDTWAD